MDKNKKLFPQRLWDLVNSNKYSQFLRWSDDGRRVYLNRAEFEEQYLRTPHNQFHTQKAISFVRQMNMYGFKKVDDFHYENDNFRRDCHHLIKNMIRRNSNKPFGVSSSSTEMDLQRGAVRSSIMGADDGNCLLERNQGMHHLTFESAHSNEGAHTNSNELAGDSTSGFFMSNNGLQNSLQILTQQLASIHQTHPGLVLNMDNASIVQNFISMLPQTTNLGMRPTVSQSQHDAISGNQSPASNITQSSLASTLYQRLALLSEQQKQQLLQQQQLMNSVPRQLHQEPNSAVSIHQDQEAIRQMAQSQQAEFVRAPPDPILTDPTPSSSLQARFIEQQRAIINNCLSQASRTQQLSAFDLSQDSPLVFAPQTLAAQQVLQQTLVGSLMQLSVAQAAPQSFNNYLTGEHLGIDGAGRSITSGSSSVLSFEHDLRHCDPQATSSSSSSHGNTRSHSTSSSNNRNDNGAYRSASNNEQVGMNFMGQPSGINFGNLSMESVLTSGTENDIGSSSDSNDERMFIPNNVFLSRNVGSNPCMNRESGEVINLVNKRVGNKSV